MTTDQTTYVMTEAGNDIVGRWEACSAKTLTGAKREASARFGGGYLHHHIAVGIKHLSGRVQQVATRGMDDGRWTESI